MIGLALKKQFQRNLRCINIYKLFVERDYHLENDNSKGQGGASVVDSNILISARVEVQKLPLSLIKVSSVYQHVN